MAAPTHTCLSISSSIWFEKWCNRRLLSLSLPLFVISSSRRNPPRVLGVNANVRASNDVHRGAVIFHPRLPMSLSVSLSYPMLVDAPMTNGSRLFPDYVPPLVGSAIKQRVFQIENVRARVCVCVCNVIIATSEPSLCAQRHF